MNSNARSSINALLLVFLKEYMYFSFMALNLRKPDTQIWACLFTLIITQNLSEFFFFLLVKSLTVGVYYSLIKY